MKLFTKKIFFLILTLNIFTFSVLKSADIGKINRKILVDRHKVVITATNPKSPAQVGNGEFAFGVDITGLQTFVPFNTLAHWSWHSFPLPEGKQTEEYKGGMLDTHGRMVKYPIKDNNQPELSDWLAANPHCFNLGRIGFVLAKSDGTQAKLADLKNTRQEIDLWSGIINSFFTFEGKPVVVKTACHPNSDAIGVSVISDLIKTGQIKVLIDFSYPDNRQFADYLGDYNNWKAHSSTIVNQTNSRASITRTLDKTNYLVSLCWTSKAQLLSGDTILSPHRFYLSPTQTNELTFTCAFSQEKNEESLLSAKDVFKESTSEWQKFWESGAAIDLSKSKDPRWKELERRIVLSQYLMKVNEAGSYPPQESGLVNNGWFGRFHFEMIWWHGIHYALWNRWSLLEKCLSVYSNYLTTSEERAKAQGYKGARWPKCTANIDREWPHPIHAMLIWQQPHPIYFAEMDYRLHPTKETLEKWRSIVFGTADFMADYAYYEKSKDRYILGPPMYIVSENTNPQTTFNPSFELDYWRFGLRTAQIWRERLKLGRNLKWDEVLKKLSPLPQQEGVYLTHEKIESMWTKYVYEHPALIGTFGMLPGDGVDTTVFKKTLDKVLSTWDFNKIWGWDFPMLAMAAARTGHPESAIDFLLHRSERFQFDEHGLATGGPFPYFPSNGGLLTAVAMMAGGWDGSTGDAPGFPKNGNWVVKYEGFNRMP